MKALILLSLLLLSQFAFADEAQDVQELISRCESSLEGKTTWKWNVIRVRTILELGIKVPVLASMSINPEIEIYFTKK